jgi:hypothetical protein
MSISSQTPPRPYKLNKRIVETGRLTWNSTDTSGSLKTQLRRVMMADFTNVVASTPVADVTNVVGTADSEGAIPSASGAITIGRANATTSGLVQMYRLEGL